MSEGSRREFLGGLAASALIGTPARAARATVSTAGGQATSRRMTIDLVCGAIGVKVSQSEAVDLAGRHGFESVGAQGSDLLTLGDADLAALRASMAEKKLVWGAANLPVDFRKDDETFRSTSVGLADFAKALRRAGVGRVGTWLAPASDTLTYRRYFDVITQRLREVARVLTGEGLRLGLEYVGPKTAWAAKRYPFLHTMAETRELIDAIGVGGVGLVLDSWHWYLAGDSASDIRALRNEDVVAVDLNDAPAGLAKDQQVDSARELPLATGVIPVAEFLEALATIGYDGPVRAEPFNQALNALPREESVAAAATSMKKAVALLG